MRSPVRRGKGVTENKQTHGTEWVDTAGRGGRQEKEEMTVVIDRSIIMSLFVFFSFFFSSTLGSLLRLIQATGLNSCGRLHKTDFCTDHVRTSFNPVNTPVYTGGHSPNFLSPSCMPI